MDDRPALAQITRRRFQWLCLATAAGHSAGCGTLLYPDRVGQDHDGRLDWGVVGMDAIGLVFFFVPGLIAFAVDFYNGTIFHPASYGLNSAPGEWQRIKLGRRFPTKKDISAAIAQFTGKRVTFEDGTYLTRRLRSLSDFTVLHDDVSRQCAQGELVLRSQSPE